MKSSWRIPVCILMALAGLWEFGSRISGLPDFEITKICIVNPFG